jgi:hypothetical protein
MTARDLLRRLLAPYPERDATPGDLLWLAARIAFLLAVLVLVLSRHDWREKWEMGGQHDEGWKQQSRDERAR